MTVVESPPARKGLGNPINSVRRCLIAGFGLLVLTLIAVVAGSTYMVKQYQADSAQMAEKADTALLLQGTESHVGTAGLMLQRYALDGDPIWIHEIISAADSASSNMATVRAREKNADDSEALARLDQLDATGNGLRTSLEQVVAQRASGDGAGALGTLDTMVVPFLQYRENLRAAAEDELSEVASLQAEADRSGELAFWLLVTSGVVGLILGAAVSVLIGRSILRPLSSLEATANKVSSGDMTARAPVSGPAELSKLGGVLNHMMTAVEERTEDLRLSNEELRDRNRQLLEARAQAASDALTGLFNHRKFHQKVREVIADAQQSNEAVSLIMIDVDNFKQVNDSLGHLKGDDLLRELSSTIAETAGQDCAYRYGGDEFAVLLTRSGHEDAVRVAKRLLGAVARNKHAEKITISLGVAAYPEMASTAEELIYRADMALNWAKSSGKNRVGDWHALIARKDGEMPAPAENVLDAGIATN
jgi:diguanylate cyclase (GGDEF)-like protein